MRELKETAARLESYINGMAQLVAATATASSEILRTVSANASAGANMQQQAEPEPVEDAFSMLKQVGVRVCECSVYM